MNTNPSLLLIMLFALLSITTLPVFAQNVVPDFCGSEEATQKLFNDNPTLRARHEVMESQLLQLLDGKPLHGVGSARQLFTIPVVVHVVHNGGAENISDAQVIDGVEHMNDAFRNDGVYTSSLGVNVEIEFCLATQTPAGAATNGITRTQSPLTDMDPATDDLALKNLSRWNPAKYLNMWVVKEIRSGSNTSVAAYAYLASMHGTSVDGIVTEARYFGTSPRNSKVHTHEAGHYLGLYHTFSSSCQNTNCLTQGDRVCDTPPDNSTAAIGCSSAINSCTTDDDDLSANNPFRPVASGGLGDQNDMFINYMDYGNISCSEGAFTQGQKNRMVSSLTGIRSSLLTSLGCQSACPTPVTASYTPSATNVSIGTTVTFANSSTGATAYVWKIDGVSFSTAANASYTFNNAGVYTITLTASSGGCTHTASEVIEVTCPVQAGFTASATLVNPGSSVTFTNTSSGATSYQWYVDNVATSTANNFTHTFSAPGVYSVRLVASYSSCQDESTVYIQAGNCNTSPAKRGNMWYFGSQAGIDFNSGNAVAVTNGALESGCSSTICDVNGNLLFYTDGDSVWNKNHQLMPNGKDLDGSEGNIYPTVIVPKPGDANLYYIFYSKTLNVATDGFKYAIVDMRLDNGKGDVTISNQLIRSSTGRGVAAVPHSNGTDYWIIVTGSPNGFYAYQLSAAGLSTNPVFTSLTPGVAAFTVSKDFSRIATSDWNNWVKLYNFNNTTGAISASTLDIPVTDIFCMEFSPDNSRLYVGQYIAGFVYQYNLNAGSSSAIISSKTTVGSSCTLISDIQTAPDGKIYIASNNYRNYLHRISNPNALGTACTFQFMGFHLGGKKVEYLMPDFPVAFQSGSTQPIAISGSAIVTEGTTGEQYTINLPYDAGSTYTWTLSGDAVIQAQTNTTITLDFPVVGSNSLVIIKADACSVDMDTLVINVIPQIELSLGNDTAFCNSNTLVLNAGAGFASYQWQNGSTNQTFSATTEGIYWVRATTTSGYVLTDTIQVFLKVPNSFSIDNNGITALCNGKIAVLDAGEGYYRYTWQDGWREHEYTAYLPGTYSVTIADPCGNTVSDEVTLAEEVINLFDLGSDTMHCGTDFTLTAPPGHPYYNWQDGSSDSIYTVTMAGTYALSVTTSDGCMSIDTIEVQHCTSAGNEPAFDFTIYPNPAQSKVHVALPASIAGNATVELVNVLGKQMESKFARTTSELNITGLAPGVYFIKVVSGRDSVSKKFVVL